VRSNLLKHLETPMNAQHRSRIVVVGRIAGVIAIVPLLVACSAQPGGPGPTSPTALVETQAPSASALASPTGGVAAETQSAKASPSARPSSSPQPAEEPDEQQTVETVAYFLLPDRDGGSAKLVPVRRLGDASVVPVQAALDSLFGGPTPFEADSAGITTAIPASATLVALDPDDPRAGVVSVDVSGGIGAAGSRQAMRARLAQLVYTVTRVPGVTAMHLLVDGRAVTQLGGEPVADRLTRDSFLDFLPSIFVDWPAWGANIASPIGHDDAPEFILDVTGRANVFEAKLHAGLFRPDGTVIDQASTTASCGTGCWGDFEVVFLTNDPGDVVLRVWTASARDGSPENVREYPLTLVEPSADGTAESDPGDLEDYGSHCGC
jgi:spore germination protein GerM